MGQFAPCERETIIIMNDESHGALISTYQKRIYRLIAKLANENPDFIDPNEIREYYEDSCIEVGVPDDWISIRPPKKYLRPKK